MLGANELSAAQLSGISTIGDIPCRIVLALGVREWPANSWKILPRPRLTDVNWFFEKQLSTCGNADALCQILIEVRHI
jgi:hypothetical protein